MIRRVEHRNRGSVSLLHRCRRSRWLIWLGLLAVGLLVVVPVISRVTLAERGPEWVVAWCGTPPKGHPGGIPLWPSEHCGYCDFLNHHPLLGHTAPAVTLLSPPPVAPADAPLPAVHHALPLLAAAPRGPPLMTIGATA